ncbi:hypothetical protein ACFS07_06390 [Undibacterium arcticum]
MDDGSEMEYGPGDVFYMPPGHDAQGSWKPTLCVVRCNRRRKNTPNPNKTALCPASTVLQFHKNFKMAARFHVTGGVSC